MTSSTAYPDDLREVETKLVDVRRRAVGVPPSNDDTTPRIGLALSGGGVRSATFALGVLQALAAKRCLERIDFLSTVSGGGYIGSFVSRFFGRDVGTYLTVEETLERSPQQTRSDQSSSVGNVLGWLRENGRYLAPTGSGDLLTGAAVMLRNWVAVHVVLACLLLMLLLIPQLLRQLLHVAFPAGLESLVLCGNVAPTDSAMARFDVWISCQLPLGQTWLWWSPYVALVPLAIACWVVPVGWAYWLSPPRAAETSSGRLSRATFFARAGFVFAWIVAAAICRFAPAGDAWFSVAARVVLLLASLTAFFSVAVFLVSLLRQVKAQTRREYIRRTLSDWLKVGLLALAALFSFVLVDSVGQTIYTVAIDPKLDLTGWIAGVFGALTALAASARRFVVAIAPANQMRPWSAMTLSALGIVAAIAVYLMLLSGADALAHGLAWNFGAPTHAPSCIGVLESKTSSCSAILENAPPRPTGATASFASLVPALLCFVFLVILNWFIGKAWTFINDSTIQPLYWSRLGRAYLGATNPRRVPLPGSTEDFSRVIEVAPGDDIAINELWWNETRHGTPGAFSRGAPLHLINVTINETLDGRTGIQNNDRRGTGMAIGPAGISVGIKHHIVIKGPGWACFPRDGFRVFNYSDASLAEPKAPFEELTLAQWTGLSGAAFSTGLGARTSLGLSLLAGFFNIRLGYWWNSGVAPVSRFEPSRWRTFTARLFTRLFKRAEPDYGNVMQGSLGKFWMGRLFTWAFPLQSYLFDEFVARFHGTGRQWWYISDGGHFENMGAYELLRRRLPLIFIVDAEADTDFRFEGLANLVRKARLDFNAEVRFVDDVATQLTEPGLHKCFGSLDLLRPGSKANDAMSSDGGARNSACHAALAEVCYDGATEPTSWIIYIKPSLTGDEPADITQYRSENPEFPQQPTSDQFFDEAQWESYRRLGEHIGRKIFAEGLAPYIHLTSVA